jgi:hypothetical protein
MRRIHNPVFKAQVPFTALRDDKNLSRLCQQFES